MAGKFTIFEKRKPINPEADVNRYADIKFKVNVTFKSSGKGNIQALHRNAADALAVSGASLYDRLFSRGLSPTSTDTPAIRAGAGKSPVTKL
jgi:hypothetical protein